MNGDGRPRIHGVLETCLYAENLAGTALFYEEVLGLEPLSRVEGRHVFYRCGSGVFLLFEPGRTRESGGSVPAHGSTGPGHVAFAVAARQIRAWARRLAENGVEIEQEVRWPNGSESLYLRDPAGNSVELASPAIWSIQEDESFGRA